MPRAAQFKITAIQELLRQLDYAPEQTRLRQMDAAERLIADVDPQQNYPQDFITFRITGYRPDTSDEPVTFVGEALLPDLVTLVQTLSENLPLRPHDLQREALALPDIAAKLRVSHKTIQRYRKQGLVCHYITLENGEKRLSCFKDALDRFIAAHRGKLAKAAGFQRMQPDIESQLISKARLLREHEGLSLNEAALRLAREAGRAHETVRQLLRRHDRAAASPIFTERGPLSDRDARCIMRAWRRGVDPALLARRFGKSRSTIHRSINRTRSELLRSLNIDAIRLPTFDLPDAENIILSAPAAVTDLNPSTADAMRWIAAAHEEQTPQEDAVHARAAAYNLLKWRAARQIAALGEWPRSGELDAIETDLRWASRLRRTLVLHAIPAALRRVEQNFRCSLRDQLPDEITALLQVAIEVVARTVEQFDPSRGQILDRVVGLAMDKSLAKIVMPQLTEPGATRRAQPRVHMPVILERLNAWDVPLNLRTDLEPFVHALAPADAQIIRMHFGLHGEPPLTLAMIARRTNASAIAVARSIQRCVRELRASVRSGKR